jgi:pyridoxamine 5'-phosphate oxidase
MLYPEDGPRGALRPEQLGTDPMAAFARWFDDAEQSGEANASACCLATASPTGVPSARMVLLKANDARGFVFYTNKTSRKAREIEQTRVAALVFFWPTLDRQVRAEGNIEDVPDSLADRYFASRPRLSQLGAWASHQSREIGSRDALFARVKELDATYGDSVIPRPPHWGGYRLVPDRVEFWQGHPHRLNDRVLFRRGDSHRRWDRVVLAP